RSRASGVPRGRWLAPPLLVAMVGLAWPIVHGGFASQRLSASGTDLAIRQAHWADALALRDDGGLNLLLGEGLGRYPAAHYWRSAESPHASAFGLVPGVPGVPGQALRLTPGAPVYIEQIVPVRAGQAVRLSLQLRSQGTARLGVALCEKWLLTSAACAGAEIQLDTATPAWQARMVSLAGPSWQAEPASAWRPVKLALFHAGGTGTLDVAGLQLRAGGSDTELLQNGDFSQGLGRWFFSTDIDPPWHVHNTPVQVLFEQGLLGVLAWGLAAAAALWRSARRAWAGDAMAASVFAALAGLVVCGLLNTLTDDPRLLGVLLLLLGLALAPAPTGAGAGLARSRRLGPSATLTAPP
ncbi:MAG: hypothetical protein CFE45_42205, partial [Burkholderiales bacterium PBB5]